MLKNDTLKNDTSRIGLYGSAPPGLKSLRYNPKLARGGHATIPTNCSPSMAHANSVNKTFIR